MRAWHICTAIDVDDALPAALEYRDVLFNCANGSLLECDDSE
ncbi:MAG: hypothetical protein AAFX50_21375 [Acidobacteriota bacterium]